MTRLSSSVHSIDVARLYYRLLLLLFLPRRRRFPIAIEYDAATFCSVVFIFSSAFSSFSSFQAHINFRFGFHSCPNSCSSSFLSKSRIFRGNPFPHFLSEYFVSYMSFLEIFAPRISYVVIMTRCVQRINASITSSQSFF